MKKAICFSLFFILIPAKFIQAQDTLAFKGQLSGWLHYNSENKFNTWSGGRYIPQLNYTCPLKNNHQLDWEASANVFGTLGTTGSNSLSSDGRIKPYRMWGRYSARQFEFRVGLQKINFGSASLLRPLMWFDQVDPRDPLKLTDGVWGSLARYYFLNNANVWIWGLYGNENPKGWEAVKSNTTIPEFGGRFQVPMSRGEAALSYHHRIADSRDLDDSLYHYAKIPENRIGFDVRFDRIVGCWLEASWVTKSKKMGMLTNQEILNLGMDYTFGLGNGLNATFEQLFAAYDEKAFEFSKSVSFSLLNLNYPIGLFDHISLVVYYDWRNKTSYNFINWQKQLNKVSFYVMGYINPANYTIPTQESGKNFYAGSGIQLMLVYNY